MQTQSRFIRLTALAALAGALLSATACAIEGGGGRAESGTAADKKDFFFGDLIVKKKRVSGGGRAESGTVVEPNQNLAVSQPAAPVSSTERRIALVIGNSNYDASPLRNPVNDARATASALRQSGFQVTERLNLTQAQMRDAIRVFGDQLHQGGVGLFYYAGHGMQVKGRNYLIPVRADIKREDEVADQAVSADAVLQKMESAKNRLNIVILDACRNNPFARSFRSSNQGLAQMDAPSGTLLAYATAPGSVASDGSGANGLYTQHLVASLRTPGLKIEDVFKRVRVNVKRDSNGLQIPWENTSLEGDFYFRPGSGTPAALAVPTVPRPAVSETKPLK